MLTQQIEEKRRRLEELRRRKEEREKSFINCFGTESEDQYKENTKTNSCNENNNNLKNSDNNNKLNNKLTCKVDESRLNQTGNQSSLPIYHSAYRNNITIDGRRLDDYVQDLLQSGAKSLSLPLACEVTKTSFDLSIQDSSCTATLDSSVQDSSSICQNGHRDADKLLDLNSSLSRDLDLDGEDKPKLKTSHLSGMGEKLLKSMTTTYDKICQTEFEEESSHDDQEDQQNQQYKQEQEKEVAKRGTEKEKNEERDEEKRGTEKIEDRKEGKTKPESTIMTMTSNTSVLSSKGKGATGNQDLVSNTNNNRTNILSDEAKIEIENSVSYQKFFVSASRTVERVLNEKDSFDVLIDYADEVREKLVTSVAKGSILGGGKQSHMAIQENKGIKIIGPFGSSARGHSTDRKFTNFVLGSRSVMDINWSPHHPELFLVCFNHVDQSLQNAQSLNVNANVNVNINERNHGSTLTKGPKVKNIDKESHTGEKNDDKFIYSYMGSNNAGGVALSSHHQQRIDMDGLVEVWSLAMGPTRPEYTFTYESTVLTALFHSNNPFLIVGGTASGQIIVWDIRLNGFSPGQRSPIYCVDGHVYPIYNLSFILGSTSQDTLVSSSTDGRCCFWNLANLSEPLEIKTFYHVEKIKGSGSDGNNSNGGSDSSMIFGKCITSNKKMGQVGWSTVPITDRQCKSYNYNRNDNNDNTKHGGIKNLKKTEVKLAGDGVTGSSGSFQIATMIASIYDTCNLANPHDIEIVLGGQDGSVQVGFLSERNGVMYSSNPAAIDERSITGGLENNENRKTRSLINLHNAADLGNTGFASYSGDQLAKLITSPSISLSFSSGTTSGTSGSGSGSKGEMSRENQLYLQESLDHELNQTQNNGHFGLITCMDRNSYSKYKGSSQRRSNKLHRLVCTSSIDWTIKIWDTFCLFPCSSSSSGSNNCNSNSNSNSNSSSEPGEHPYEKKCKKNERSNVNYYPTKYTCNSNESATNLLPLITLSYENNFDPITTVKWSPHHPSLLAAGTTAGEILLWNLAISCEEPICHPIQIHRRFPDGDETRKRNEALAMKESQYKVAITSLKWHPTLANRLIVGDALGKAYLLLLDDKHVAIRGDEEIKIVTMMNSKG